MTVALVMGGSRGIGLACARALKAAGVKVAIAARAPIKEEFDMFCKCDLSNRFDRKGLIEWVADILGGLDILVNNAGMQNHANALDYRMYDWNYQIELMLTAPFDLSQQAGRYMLEHGGGHIVNILSTAAFQGARNIVGYVASKHGLLGLTRALAIEFAPLVQVNAIAPGMTETDMIADLSADRRELLESITPAGRFGRTEEIAEALLYLVNSTYVYGQTIVVDGGWLVKNG